jgi:hypothetical protein
VEHHHHLLGRSRPKARARSGVEDAVGVEHLDLEVVVARAQGPDLPAAALDGAFAHALGVRAGEAAAGLRAREILGQP